jgi:hypothetical protein
MKKRPRDVICELRAAGWRIYLDGWSTAPDGVPWDFLPGDDDDLIPCRMPQSGRCGARLPVIRCRRVTGDKQAY